MTVVLAVSLVLQIVAAVLALRLARVTGKRLAWSLVAAAVCLMAIRRAITLVGVLSGDVTPDAWAETVALTISILMVAGIGWVAPLVLTPRRVEEVAAREDFAAGEVHPGEAAVDAEEPLDLVGGQLVLDLPLPDVAHQAAAVAAVGEDERELEGERRAPEVRRQEAPAEAEEPDEALHRAPPDSRDSAAACSLSESPACPPGRR